MDPALGVVGACLLFIVTSTSAILYYHENPIPPFDLQPYHEINLAAPTIDIQLMIANR